MGFSPEPAVPAYRRE